MTSREAAKDLVARRTIKELDRRCAALGLVTRPITRVERGRTVEVRERGNGLYELVFGPPDAPDGLAAWITEGRSDAMPDALHVADAKSEAARLAALLECAIADLAAIADRDATISDFCDKLSQSYEEMHCLFRSMRQLACPDSPRNLIDAVCADFQKTLPFRWIALAFHDGPRISPSLRSELIVAGDLNADPEAFRALAREKLGRLSGDSWTRTLTADTHPLAQLVGTDVLVEPVTHDDMLIGVLVAGGKLGRDPDISSEEVQFLDAAADFLGTFHENISRLDEQRAMTMSTLEALVAAIDAKDRYTCGHSERVALLSMMLATDMGLDRATATRVRLSGLVHDVGKIGVPEAILTKPGRPTDEEFAAIRRHPEIGYRILENITGFGDLLPGVLHHHERWDGKGYPHKLAGEDIPLFGRIIGVADAFDAMSSTRSYRSALPRERVLDEVRGGAGKQFDPDIARAMLALDLTEYDLLLQKHADRDGGNGEMRLAA